MATKHFALLFTVVTLLLTSLACILFVPPRGPIEFHPDQLPPAQVDVPYDVQVTITGNVTPAIDFSPAGAPLPPGLKIEKIEGMQDTAHIFGTPEHAGTFTFGIYVYCYGTNVSGQTGEKQYSLVVK